MPRNHRRGGAIVTILLTVFLLGALAIAGLVATGLYIARNSSFSDDDGRHLATIETPFGTVRVRDSSHYDPGSMGLPLYPGAVRQRRCRDLASFHLDFGHLHKSFSVSAAEYRTPDSVDQVTEYYRRQLPHWLYSEHENGSVHLSFTRRGYRNIVAIHEEGGETRIALASVGEPASN